MLRNLKNTWVWLKNRPEGPTLVFFLGLVLYRGRTFLIHPRFFAEEGSVYFANAWNLGFWASLFHVDSFGYLNLYAKLGAGIAAWAPSLENAPFYTSLMGMLAMVLPLFILFLRKGRLWDTWWKKVFLATLIVTADTNAEAWFNLVGAQYFLALAFFMLLISPTANSSVGRNFSRAVIVVSALSGMIPTFFAIPFVWAMRRTEDAERRIQLILLSIATSVQWILFIPKLSENLAKTSAVDCLAYSAWFWLHEVISKLLPPSWAEALGLRFLGLFQSDPILGATLSLGCLSMLGGALVVFANEKTNRTLACGFISVSVLTYSLLISPKIAHLSPSLGTRFGICGAFLFWLLALNSISRIWPDISFGRKVLVTVFGVLFFGTATIQFQKYDPEFFTGQDWIRQVDRNRNRNPSVYKIWPKKWKMELKRSR